MSGVFSPGRQERERELCSGEIGAQQSDGSNSRTVQSVQKQSVRTAG